MTKITLNLINLIQDFYLDPQDLDNTKADQFNSIYLFVIYFIITYELPFCLIIESNQLISEEMLLLLTWLHAVEKVSFDSRKTHAFLRS